MPRVSGKINAHEREICVRVRLFRESIGWTQDRFSNQIGISLNQLAGIEYARVPLRYDIVWKIRQQFGVAIAWISNGNYPPDQPDFDPWPNPELEGKGLYLLSDAERFILFSPQNTPARKQSQTAVVEHIAGKSIQKPDRSILLSVLKDNLVEWLASVPDEQIEGLATEIIHHGQSYADKFSKTKSSKTSVRARALIWGQMREDINKRLSPKDSKDLHLTDTASSENLFALKAQLPILRERLNRATKASGQMSALAKFLDVPLASVSRWLAGKREPSGEVTLRLLKWVEQQERKQ